MSLSLKVPALGESVREATLGAWRRGEGDYVEIDEPLVEVESEKATFEVPSPGAGVLRRILRKAGETVAVGEVIAEIEPGSREAGKGNGHAEAAPAPTAPSVPATASASPSPSSSSADEPLRAPPSARRLLAETGLPSSEVKGTGRGG